MVILPVNGYINRIQAVASAAVLASELGSELIVCWEVEDVAGSPASEVFSPEFCAAWVRDRSAIETQLGISLSSLPRYLHVDPEHRLVSLAGNDRGEQHFMAELAQTIDTHPECDTLVLIAGGNFSLLDRADGSPVTPQQAIEQRGAWYRACAFNPLIEAAAEQACAQHRPFSALHLRYTDRAHQAPSQQSIRAALQALRQRASSDALFVASDTSASRDRWMQEARAMGFEPWTIEHAPIDRAESTSAHAALIDWRILGSSEATVYFASSSFAHEAAVASGNLVACIALQPDPVNALSAKARELGRALVTYPRRHGWLG